MRATVASGPVRADSFCTTPGLVGITGGVGAGKSTVLDIMQAGGASVLDTDRVAHGLYAPGEPAYQEMIRRWGPDILAPDGTINRGRVANRVFQCATERRWLNQLLHPMVREYIHARARGKRSLLFCGVPLLFEVGWQCDMWCTVAVWCPPETQVDRLHGRGWSDNEIQNRLAAQFTTDEKLRKADYGLINSGTLPLLQQQCEMLLGKLQLKLTAGDNANSA